MIKSHLILRKSGAQAFQFDLFHFLMIFGTEMNATKTKKGSIPCFWSTQSRSWGSFLEGFEKDGPKQGKNYAMHYFTTIKECNKMGV